MKVQVISDMHLEFYSNAGFKQVSKMKPTGVDTVIIAGDLTLNMYLKGSLNRICTMYEDVYYVPGNHEYYKSSFDLVKETLQKVSDLHSNFHWLSYEQPYETIGNRKILGDTLWFKQTQKTDMYSRWLNDFRCIDNFEYHVYEENRKAVEFFKENVTEGCVVVSHHLPTWKSIDERYVKDSEMQDFYCCDLTDLILDRKPYLWVHGHSHVSKDYMLEETRVAANPQGYPGEKVTTFGPHFVVEI